MCEAIIKLEEFKRLMQGTAKTVKGHSPFTTANEKPIISKCNSIIKHIDSLIQLIPEYMNEVRDFERIRREMNEAGRHDYIKHYKKRLPQE